MAQSIAALKERQGKSHTHRRIHYDGAESPSEASAMYGGRDTKERSQIGMVLRSYKKES